MFRGRKKRRSQKHASTSPTNGENVSTQRVDSPEPRLTIEQLEPRILLSADPLLLAMLDAGVDDSSERLEESPVLVDQLEDLEVDGVAQEATTDDWIVDGQGESAVLDDWATPANSIP